MRINYGICKRVKSGMVFENHYLHTKEFPSTKTMLKRMASKHKGWSLIGWSRAGWCPAGGDALKYEKPIADMLDHELNAEIQKERGWTDIRHEEIEHPDIESRTVVLWSGWCGVNRDGQRRALPDCCNDLNEMNKAESEMPPGERKRFRACLREVMSSGRRGTIAIEECIHAKARQRAEAYLMAKRTINIPRPE